MKDFDDRVAELLPGLHRFARSLSRNATEADDLVQECAARALAARGTWRGDNLKSWLTTIMVNQYRNDLRRARAAPVTVPMEEWQGEAPDMGAGDPLKQQRLRIALDQLVADQRLVLMLVVVEGYRYEEVAGLLDIPIGTVMSRLSRARKTMGEILKADNIVEFRRSR